MTTTMTTVPNGEDRCRCCAADMERSDHCPECACEAFNERRECEARCCNECGDAPEVRAEGVFWCRPCAQAFEQQQA